MIAQGAPARPFHFVPPVAHANSRRRCAPLGCSWPPPARGSCAPESSRPRSLAIWRSESPTQTSPSLLQASPSARAAIAESPMYSCSRERKNAGQMRDSRFCLLGLSQKTVPHAKKLREIPERMQNSEAQAAENLSRNLSERSRGNSQPFSRLRRQSNRLDPGKDVRQWLPARQP